MPSIFEDTTLSPHVTRTHCPPFSPEVVERACKAQAEALAARHASQQQEAMRALRQQIAERLRVSKWEPLWPAAPAQPLLLAAPNTLPLEIAGEVARLRETLPSELQQIVEAAAIALPHKLALAQRFDAALVEYENAVAEAARMSLEMARITHQQRIEQRLLEERLKAAIARWKGPTPGSSTDEKGGSSPFHSVIPGGTFNVFDVQPRYFRILVWNLENFTRDRRPRGAQPMDSMRNQARVAILADVLARIHVDLLLIMETGSDVGTAATRIAQRTALKVRDTEGIWEPLVSPPTGALPEVKIAYPDVQIRRPSGLKAMALRALFDAYVVTPRYGGEPAEVTGQQIVDAWSVLKQSSPEAKRRLLPLDSPEAAILNGFPHPRLAMGLVTRLYESAGQVAGAVGGSLRENFEVVHRIAHEVANELTPVTIETSGGPMLVTALQTEPDEIAYAILSAREARLTIDDVEPTSEDAVAMIEEGVACLQAIELVLLFALKARERRIPTDGLAGRVFRSDSSEDGLVALAVFLCTGAQRVALRAVDPKLGPAGGEVDNDVLLDALQRLGVIERHIETYAIVYRQPFPGALESLLELGVQSHGFSGGIDEEAARYGIIRAPLSRESFSIQEAGGLLNWRSALQITVPASRAVALPLVVYHTRYSGTAAIKAMREDLTNDENTVLARCMSVWQIAGAVLPGHSELGPPLLVGDFNVPDVFLNEQPSPRSKAKKVVASAARKLEIRRGFSLEMASRGYLRHSTGRALNTGYPCTTLKAYSSIARGDDILSQPYDGTYQPFDYAGGRAAIASGIVGIRALLADSVLDEDILGVPSQAIDGGLIDLDAGETGDDALGAPEDEGGSEGEAPTATWTVLLAISVEVGRVYRSLIRPIHQPIEDLMGYIHRQLKKGASTRLQGMIAEIERRHAAYEAGAAERVQWFVKSCAARGTQTCLAATGKDWLADWQTLLRDVGLQADLDGRSTGFEPVSKRFNHAADAVKAVQDQLAVLETDPEIRRAIAYRAVVSDHLPQLLEVDLQPG
ncbi:hypothetical protein WMF04_12230 [Sorangium sp. So ce260]|uniref:hypothetical protein n=1 Tax=Sorangium sp. So ce260 TaxID=3133291 RepID=UPI003F6428D9